MKCNLSDEQIERRLDMVEKLIATADQKDLPSLNKTFERLIDEQVRRDLEPVRSAQLTAVFQAIPHN